MAGAICAFPCVIRLALHLGLKRNAWERMGAHDHYETKPLTKQCDPWGAWGPWLPPAREKVAGEGTALIQVRRKYRRCRARYLERFVTAKCEYFDFGHVHIWRTTSTYYRWRERFGPWEWETAEEMQWNDPPKALFPWRFAIAPPVIRGCPIRVLTSWIAKLDGVKSYKAFLDSERQVPDFRIETATMSPGVHFVDYVVSLADKTTRTYQVTFSLIDKVDVWFSAPVKPLTVASSRKAHFSELTVCLRNNTDRLVTRQLEILGVPMGWRALFLESAVVSLLPGKTKRLRIGVELVDTTGIATEPLPFTVGIVPDGDPRRSAEPPHRGSTATGYLQLRLGAGYRNKIVEIERSRRALLRRDAVLPIP